VTDDAFGNASPRMDVARKTIPREIGPLLERGLTPVVTGFVAANEEGVITTLGRGGSDYTATILGACLPADEVWVWKEVDGVMTADPKLVPDAVRVPALSYREVMELAWFGAKVLHPMTVAPVQQAGIPLRIRSAFLPSSPGTLVCEAAPGSGPVKAVTSIRRLTALTVSAGPTTGTSELVGRVFKVLAAAGLQVLMISQSSSLANVSLVMPQADADKANRLLRRELAGSSILGDIAVVPHVSIVTIVGDGMRGTPGIASLLCSPSRPSRSTCYDCSGLQRSEHLGCHSGKAHADRSPRRPRSLRPGPFRRQPAGLTTASHRRAILQVTVLQYGQMAMWRSGTNSDTQGGTA